MDSSASDVDGTRRGNMDLNNENADDHSASDVSPQESAEHAIIYQEENPLDMSEQFMGTELNPIFSELDPNLEPYLGMEFDSVESAKAFYYAYASQMGFSARKNRSRRSRRDESIIMRRFVCTREEGAASVEIYKVAKQALQKAFAEVSAAKSMHRRGQQHLQRFVRAQKISYKRPLPKLPQKRTSAGGAQRSEDNNKRGNKTDDSNKIEEESFLK
ncbi:hypothetical protein QJS10_CPB11g00012 [Acorus calamus]|uniref:FAR1 domain-containing protein n=1 Tax=Acorus calamus TaxID=4465 RepID=A0AAV9DVD7_ACOCL|nr:hypothetical protein QJS10_CPB11g00012 [Acorus calamus]